MYLVKNENGYALVTVFMIITVFMLVFLTFMGQAFSSVKQNEVVEQSSQSVAVAEMGVSYYQVAIQNIFETKQADVNTHVSNLLNANPSLIDNYKEETAKIMASTIKQALLLEPSQVNIIEVPGASFSISNIDTELIPDTNKIKISFSISGTEGGKTSTLASDMSLDLDSIIRNGDAIKFALPTFNEVPRPQTGCTTFANGCNEVLLENGQAFPGKTNNNGNNNNLSDKTVYATRALTVDGNANNSYNLKVHSDGSITTEGNMNKASKVTLETPQDLILKGHLTVETESRILVGNDLVSEKFNFKLDDKSFAFIADDALINKLEISSDSTMCIQGDLTITDTLLPSSNNLIVFGKINGTATNISQETFEAKCGKYDSINLTLNWGQSIYTKINNVKYNK